MSFRATLPKPNNYCYKIVQNLAIIILSLFMLMQKHQESKNTKTAKFFKYSPLFAVLLIALLAVVKGLQIKKAIAEGMGKGPPAMSVTTTEVSYTPWNSIIKTVGSVEPAEGAVLGAEEAGRIAKIHKEDGSNVTKGELIIEIDARVEESEYHAARAQSELLQKTFQRQKKLYEANAISAEEFDTAELNYKASRAQAEALKARVDRKQIRAPFDGTLGVRRVNIGQYVRQGDPLIPLQNLSNIYVSFSLSQDDIKLVKIGDKVFVSSSMSSSDKNTSREASPQEASIVAIDPSISPNSKTGLLKAVVHTSEDTPKLIPGSFVHLEIHIDDTRDVLAIPSTSILYAPFGDSVYVVEEVSNDDGSKTKIANPVFIKILDRRGDLTAVTSGISEGTEIVTSGTFKLFPGVKLIINNEVLPPQEMDPKPLNR